MFLKPKWYGILPDSLKPIDNETIRLIEEYRSRHILPDEAIFMAIINTKWAVKKIQRYTLESFRRQFPNLSEKELWKSVIASRLQARLYVYSTMGETDPFAKPLSEQEIHSLMENVDKAISNFKTFDDVIQYIINIDEKENRFYDPTGVISSISKILEGYPDSSKDSIEGGMKRKEENNKEIRSSEIMTGIRKKIIDYLVEVTGIIMKDVDEIIARNSLKEMSIEMVGAYAYFFVYDSLSSALGYLTTIKELNINFPYLNVYKKEVCKAHASKPESASFVEEAYERLRQFYILIDTSKDTNGENRYFRLAGAFFDGEYEISKKDFEDNFEFRDRVVKSIAEFTSERQSDLTDTIAKELLKVESAFKS